MPFLAFFVHLWISRFSSGRWEVLWAPVQRPAPQDDGMHVIPGRHEAALWDCCRDPGPGRLVFPGGTALGESFATWSSGKPGRFSPRFAALRMIQLMSFLFHRH